MKLSPFSLILTMVVLMIIGAALIPQLHLAYNPSPKQGDKLSIAVSWSGASAQVMESQVVSPLEAVLSTVVGIDEITSRSSEQGGNVYITLKEDVNIASKRFEIASLLRQTAETLPKGVSYPQLNGGSVSQGVVGSKRILSYTINADMEKSQISHYLGEGMVKRIKQVEGVTNVHLTGSSPNFLDIEYDPIELERIGLDARDIATGIKDFLGRSSIIGDVDKINSQGDKQRLTILLQSEKGTDIGRVPLGVFEGRMVYLRDVTKIESKVRSQENYFRINGMNTINMNIYIDGEANVIAMSDKLLEVMNKEIAGLKEGYYFTLTSDSADEIRKELNSLISRTLLALVILLVFVWLASRQGKYLSIIALTLLANILIATIFYYLLDVELHLFSLAGITVSFGIIIDTSIVMVDHYNYYRNRGVFTAILAALLTTIGSLVIIFFMPEYIKANLTDFSAVIIINLGVSLLISLLFIPALVEKMGMQKKKKSRSTNRKIIVWNKFYIRYIIFTQKRKWIYITILVLAFGLPVHLLPAKIGETTRNRYIKQEKKEDVWYESLYNNTIGSDWYQQSLREPIEKTLGGTLRLFAQSLDSRTFSQREKQTKLTITARLTEGNDGDGNGAILNLKMLEMDRFLSGFEQINRFETSVNGDYGRIEVSFTDSIQDSGFPYVLEAEVISRAISIGGVDWSTYGVSERGFSNSLNLDRKSYAIELTGYNYQRLHNYAQMVADDISLNSRAEDVAIEDGQYRYGGRTEKGLALDYDTKQISLYNINLRKTHSQLSELLNSEGLGSYRGEGYNLAIDYHSSRRNSFDLWNLMNRHISIDGQEVLYGNIASITERNAKQTIEKRNQEYTISVAYNFLGSYTLADNFTNEVIDKANEMLPVGFAAKNRSWGWYDDSGEQYWLILLIVVIIFFMCAILFESLHQPLVIISLIPISFIGTFLTYYFTEIPFGTGGFASLVLLSGLVVNSAIYLINEYNSQLLTKGRLQNNAKLYVKAYNHKIVPILLTILSTALGLVPFFTDGIDGNEFWFSFAVGSISGLIFSLFALVFVMPILMKLMQQYSSQPSGDNRF